MKKMPMNAYIAGTGSFIPEHRVTNKELFQWIEHFELDRARHSVEKKGNDTSDLTDAEVFDLWVRQVCGIEERPYLTEEFTSKGRNVIERMAAIAGEKAITAAGLKPDDIDHVIFSTYSGEIVMPGPAAGLTETLGLKNASGRSINGACSGYLDALIDAGIKANGGHYENILVVAAEYLSNKIDFKDVTTSILFSDGAGASVVKSGESKIKSFSSRLKFNNEHITMNRGEVLKMGGGPLVQRKAVLAMEEVSLEALNNAGVHLNQVKYIIPHQANIRILTALEEKLGLSEETKMVKSIHTFGNLSSATLPVAMDRLIRNEIKDIPYEENNYALLCSVGGGYTFSAMLIEL